MMTRGDLVPTKACFGRGDSVQIEWLGEQGPSRLEVTHLGDIVDAWHVDPLDHIDLGELPAGGYAVELTPCDGGPVLRTAFDVLDAPGQRPRYGFLSEFGPGRSPEEIGAATLGLRQLHLNTVQFYDWAYRHVDLVGTDEEFTDACGRRLGHATTRALIDGCHQVGALAMGYAAVYGVGMDYADEHPEQLLYHHDGSRYSLGDLLAIGNVDAVNPWHDHIIGQFVTAMETLEFDGLHLDTYGFPKIAWDRDGRSVDLAELFPPFLSAVRRALPDATLFFNNVNDYPTWTSVEAPLDTTYIEVWDPHREYRHLVKLIETARLAVPRRPVILAAYLKPFAEGPTSGAEWAARLALATIWAHGGHHLLCGEGNGVLTHPYYPNFARAGDSTMRLLRDYFDFAVANGDLLHDPAGRTVTHAHLAGEENDDLAVEADRPVTPDPRAGGLWVVARDGEHGMTVHLIDLAAQHDLEWNVAKHEGAPATEVRIRVRWGGERILFGSPELGPALEELPAHREGDHLVVVVPGFLAWGLVFLPR